MSFLKRPITALLGVLAVLLAGLFLSTATAGAYPAGVNPTLGVSDTSPSCGETVTFTGAHYQPGESVVVKAGESSVTVVADSSGDISGSLEITCPNGIAPETITATGQTSGGIDSLTLSAGSSGGSSGGLSSTGVAVVGIGALGLVLLVGGGLLLLVGKRRKVSV